MAVWGGGPEQAECGRQNQDARQLPINCPPLAPDSYPSAISASTAVFPLLSNHRPPDAQPWPREPRFGPQPAMYSRLGQDWQAVGQTQCPNRSIWAKISPTFNRILPIGQNSAKHGRVELTLAQLLAAFPKFWPNSTAFVRHRWPILAILGPQIVQIGQKRQTMGQIRVPGPILSNCYTLV